MRSSFPTPNTITIGLVREAGGQPAVRLGGEMGDPAMFKGYLGGLVASNLLLEATDSTSNFS